jgi:hypothetical protein
LPSESYVPTISTGDGNKICLAGRSSFILIPHL